MSNYFKIEFINKLFVVMLTASITMLGACGGGGGSGGAQPVDNTPNLKLAMPNSLTGGSPAVARAVAAVGTGEPCTYIGDDDEDHFRNGYKTTKFLISVIASWTCIADLVIDVSNFVGHDGSIHASDNDRSSPNYDPEDPTHYSVIDDSATQTTVRLYYGYYREAPPQRGETPQFYVSWNEAANGDIEGRLIIDGLGINPDNRDPEDPVIMRMDFNYTSTQKTADMFMRFDDANQWADGFRIHIVKDLTANPAQKVYLARGLITMKEQFLPAENITELPDVHLYSVANRAGDGASISDVVDMSLPLDLTPGTYNNHLGNYLFSKVDTYYFTDTGNWEYINKTFSSAEFRGGRTTPETGGSLDPFNPSLDIIVTELGLDADYFTGTKCAAIGNDCTPLLNAIFADGFGGQEGNQGTDPMDWRSDALASRVPLESVFPNGVNWTGAFDFTFTP